MELQNIKTGNLTIFSNNKNVATQFKVFVHSKLHLKIRSQSQILSFIWILPIKENLSVLFITESYQELRLYNFYFRVNWD